MGWFLTNATPKRSRKKSAKPQAKPWDPQRTLAGLKALGLVCALTGVVFGWAYGERSFRGYVAQRTAKPVLKERIELAGMPGWMSPTLADEMRTIVAFELGEDPMDAVSLQHAVAALRNSPWVDTVHRIERLPGGKARVTADFRRPIAVVELKEGYQLVDPQGVVLPQVYRAAEVGAVGLPPIQGVTTPPPAAGQKWADEQLAAALDLLKLLERQVWFSQVKSIDASQRDTRQRIRLVLHTERGQVTWGLPPGQEQPIEPSAATKLQWLATVYSRFGSIDNDGQTVDVFRAAAWVHENP